MSSAEDFRRNTLGDYDTVLARFNRANPETDYTMKDHRHTWAVQAFRDRLPIHAISHQLGHRDAVMALKVYGKFIPRASDFAFNLDEQSDDRGLRNENSPTSEGSRQSGS